MSKDEKIKVRSEVVVGSPADKIIKFAKAYKIDMIIVGSRRLEEQERCLKLLNVLS
jgi:nucleotide-binding universal stress UspA family protein